MNSTITLYHGSSHIIRQPQLGLGNPKNDYGLGFYCTESFELAKEWACTDTHGGYANRYELCLDGLSVLNLSDPQYCILHWLNILLQNRIFDTRNEVTAIGKQYLTEHFHVDTSAYDIIRGYRADDSYFSFAQDFLDNVITVKKLSAAMRLGRLGEQVVLISPRAFQAIRFCDAEKAEQDIFYPLRKNRDELARSEYFSGRRQFSLSEDDLFLADIIRGGVLANDPRLQ